MSEGQGGMIKVIRGNHICFGYAKVRMDVRVGDNDGMTNGIQSCLVYPGIKRGYIDILDLFTLILVDHMMETKDIGSSPKEGIPRIKRLEHLVDARNCLIPSLLLTSLSQSHSHIIWRLYPWWRRRRCFCWVAWYNRPFSLWGHVVCNG